MSGSKRDGVFFLSLKVSYISVPSVESLSNIMKIYISFFSVFKALIVRNRVKRFVSDHAELQRAAMPRVVSCCCYSSSYILSSSVPTMKIVIRKRFYFIISSDLHEDKKIQNN